VIEGITYMYINLYICPHNQHHRPTQTSSVKKNTICVKHWHDLKITAQLLWLGLTIMSTHTLKAFL